MGFCAFKAGSIASRKKVSPRGEMNPLASSRWILRGVVMFKSFEPIQHLPLAFALLIPAPLSREDFFFTPKDALQTLLHTSYENW